jgi:hypothetical protein
VGASTPAVFAAGTGGGLREGAGTVGSQPDSAKEEASLAALHKAAMRTLIYVARRRVQMRV